MGLRDVVVHYIGDKAPAVKWAHEVIEPMLGRKVGRRASGKPGGGSARGPGRRRRL